MRGEGACRPRPVSLTNWSEMKQIAVGYGKNAVPLHNNAAKQDNRITVARGAVPMAGSAPAPTPAPIETEPEIPSRGNLCCGNNDTCGARRAKGTEWCVGHLRSRGEL